MDFQWIELGLQFAVLIGAVLIIRNDNAKLHAKIDELVTTVTDIRLALKDCVTWEELARELGPIRLKGEDHDARLKEIEVTCKNHHKNE